MVYLYHNFLIFNFDSSYDDLDLEEEMATHYIYMCVCGIYICTYIYSIFAWIIPWTEEPGGLQSMESQRVESDMTEVTETHA